MRGADTEKVDMRRLISALCISAGPCAATPGVAAEIEGIRFADRYVINDAELRGLRLSVIEGANFAAAYFCIWLGAEPLDRSLRKQLLECS